MYAISHSLKTDTKAITVLGWLLSDWYAESESCPPKVAETTGQRQGIVASTSSPSIYVKLDSPSIPAKVPSAVKHEIRMKSDQGLVAVADCLRSTQPCFFHQTLICFAWRHALLMASRSPRGRLLQSTEHNSVGGHSTSRSSALAFLRLCLQIHQHTL